MTEKDESVKQNAESQTEETTENNSEEASNSVENTESNNSQDVETNEEATKKDASNEDDENVDPKDQEIERLQQLANDNEEKYLRLYAEFENYKRRIQNENKINKIYQAQGVLTDILPTIDNIERALQIEGDNDSFKSLQKGVQMVHESLLRALKDNGLEEIESEGQSFDPNVHQAVVQDDNPEYESGVITQELQKGYKLKDRVLRPSMVKVNQ
ncbi:nucleotide exchange factor GrpE [Staphylococcus warneri]|uniref:nucleotide exchange factor GrpE n=1 Tax=Staphylococcus warneri TaxID=1292 RepID=UPI0037357A5A